ncbi:MAG TPA: HD-GYP domain-containing protein [Halanaerobiales bacterium]|nr:HD-GYP domain-containing protein [Halanaerobiales bacterium]
MVLKAKGSLIHSFMKILQLYDNYTGDHSKNVAELAKKIAVYMGLEQDLVNKVYLAGLVHDIGKVIIPRSILNKTGHLTACEFEKIKEHPGWGYEILKESKQLSSVAEIVLYHHERWDGEGYPEGLSGNSIPLFSRIIAVADAWDAMTSARPYRRPLSFDEAVSELLNNKGEQFAPEVIEVFYQIIKEDQDGVLF